MMQRFAVILLAASVALLGAIIPVEAASLSKRETNGNRLARGLPPLPPVRRSPTDTAKRSTVSAQPGHKYGLLEVRWASDDTKIGYVQNDQTKGPVGINLGGLVDSDLLVEYWDSSILAKDPKFAAPYYIGGSGDSILAPDNTNTIKFTNVEKEDSAIWSLDANTNVFSATWTNSDDTKVLLSLIYDPELNVLEFTADSKPWDIKSKYPVTLHLLPE